MTQNRRTVVDPRQAERRRSLMFKIGAAVVLIAVAAGIAIWAVASNNEDSSTGGSATPTVVTEDGFIRVSAAPKGTEPKAVVSLVEDFQCPACQAFETKHGETLQELAKNPNVAIDYKPIVFLDRGGQTQFSANTSNASMCVAEATGKSGDMSVWLKFHNLLFANQQQEGSPGPSDDQLRKFAEEAGATGVSQCIKDDQFGKWLSEQSSSVLKDSGFQGTPWVRLNGKTIDAMNLSTQQLTDAVNGAAK
ncbi:DsbA family protein [Gordonia sp. MP11Mi]|uniref:Thioredoxin-like fold domain-containing protein n=1 Tax=Gordonia sp. MP11Mi TaxID=3022769 RepID=A0AA97CXK9_9ACTN